MVKPEKTQLLILCIDNFSPLKKEALKRLIQIIINKKPVVIIRNDELKKEFEGINTEFIRLCLSSMAEKSLLEKQGWSTYVVKNEVFSAFMKSNHIKIEAKDDAYFFGGGHFSFHKSHVFTLYVSYTRFYQIIAYLYSSQENNRYLALFSEIIDLFIKGNNSPISQTTIHRKHGIHIKGAHDFCNSPLYDHLSNTLKDEVFMAIKKEYIEFTYE